MIHRKKEGISYIFCVFGHDGCVGIFGISTQKGIHIHICIWIMYVKHIAANAVLSSSGIQHVICFDHTDL